MGGGGEGRPQQETDHWETGHGQVQVEADTVFNVHKQFSVFMDSFQCSWTVFSVHIQFSMFMDSFQCS